MWWHERSWPEIEAMDKQLPVVVPLGSIEQHGYHLPLAVDTIQVAALAKAIEGELPNAVLVLPTLSLGCSEHHKDFPGTVSVEASLYTQMIKSIARSILRAGFRRVFFLNGHGGNETPAAQALSELTAESDMADAAHLVFASWWQLGREGLVATKHGMQTRAITHACEYETSFMLAVRPDLVRLEAAVDNSSVADTPWYHAEYGGRVRVFHRFHRLTSAGSMGRPTLATAEKGRSMLSTITADCVAFLEEFAVWPELPVKRSLPG